SSDLEGQRQAGRREELLGERGVAVDGLGGPEVQGQDLARGVVDGAQEHELRAAGLEPRKGTAVDLHQCAERGLGDAPPTRLGWAPTVARGQTEPAARHAVLVLDNDIIAYTLKGNEGRKGAERGASHDRQDRGRVHCCPATDAQSGHYEPLR